SEAHQTWYYATNKDDGTLRVAHADDYVELDQTRREAMAQAGADLAKYLKDESKSTADDIKGAQADFDTNVALAYYQESGVGSQESGLEYTLATLAHDYDVNQATVLKNKFADVASSHSSAIWAPWMTLAAAEADVHLTDVDTVLANVVLDNRKN